jgi:capsular polysaccharide biosynthesis protein
MTLSQNQNASIVVPADVLRDQPFVSDVLRHLGVPVATVDPHEPIAGITEEFRSTCTRYTYYYPNLYAIKLVRSLLPPAPCPEGKKLFIMRAHSSQGRVLVNQKDLRVALSRFGLDFVFNEELSFEEQYRLYSNASVVIGVHGAGLSNIVFMPSGSTIIELMPEAEFKWHFALISKILGFKYFVIPIDTLDVFESRPKLVRVNPDKISDLLDSVLDEC